MSNGIGRNPLNDISKVYLEQVGKKKKKKDDSYLETDMKKRQENNEKAREDMKKMGTSMKNPHFEQKQFGWDSVNSMTKAYRAMQEGIRDEDPEKGTEERKKRLEKKRGMKMDDHPQYTKEAADGSNLPGATPPRPTAAERQGMIKHHEAEKAKDKVKTKPTGQGLPPRGTLKPNPFKGSKPSQLSTEALDPVGKEDGDVNNDGKKDDTDSYLMKRRKAIGSAMKKRLKEERAALSEVMTDKEDEKKVVEKRINNKVTINPKLSEAVEELGGEVLEMVEVDSENLDEAGGPALPGEPGRPGTPKAPGGRPHLPGEKQTPKPKKAGMLRLAHTEYSDWRSDLQEGPYVVTNADKKGNTPAYRGLKAGKLNAKTGKPLYVAAPHLKLADSHELEGEDLQELEDTSGYKLRPMGRNNPAANKPAPRINPNRSFSGRGAGRAAFRDSNIPAKSNIKQSGGGTNQGATPTPAPTPTASPKPTDTPKAVASSPRPKTPNPLMKKFDGGPDMSAIRAKAKADTLAKKAKPDIRDRDVTARASYDPRLKSERQRMKQIKAGRRMREEVELDERTRYAKETGKDPQTGKESKKGGTRTGKSAFDQVSREMRKTGGVMSSRGKGIQPQGKKKEKGKKGYKGVTPVDKIRNRLSQKRKEQPNPYRTRAGESD